jgi:hypothetical protein
MIFSKGAGINNSIYGKSQEPIKMFLEQQEEAFVKNSMIEKIWFMDTTTNFAEKYGMETSLGDFKPVGENGAYPESSFQEGYSRVVEPDTWKLKFSTTQEMIEDAKFGKIKSRAHGFILSYARTRELFSSAFFNNGNASTMSFGGKTWNTTAADNQALFSTGHTSITGGTGNQSNLYGGTITYDNICALEEKMHYFTDDDGNILNLQPDTIIIPDKAAAKKALFNAIGQDAEPGTFNNSFNIQYGRWNVIISPYLNNWSGTSGGDMMYMMDSQFNQAYQALVWLDRIKLTVNSEIDPNTDANIFKGRARYAAAPNNWRAISALAPNLSGASVL